MLERMFSNPRYSWVTYFILSNFCNFPSLSYLLTLCCFFNFCQLINLLSSYQTSVISRFVIYSLFTLSTHPINAPAGHITKHNSYARLIVRTLSVPIYLSSSPVLFGHRAILMWGDRDMAGGIPDEQPVTFKCLSLCYFTSDMAIDALMKSQRS